MWAFLRRRWLRVALGACLVAALVPLATTSVLPFHDDSGVIGLGGALALRADPVARIEAYYDLDIRPYPSALYFGWAMLAGALGADMALAFSVFWAVFGIAGPLAGLAFLLWAHKRPPALALLAFPATYHKQIWFGFLGSSAAVTGLLFALGFAKRLGERPSVGNHIGLAAAVLFVATAHPFSLALTLLVIAPLVVWPPGKLPVPALLGRYGLRLTCFLPTALFLAPWVGSFFGKRTGGLSLLERIAVEVRPNTPSLSDLETFLLWLGDGYAAGWDQGVAGIGLLTVLVLLAVGIRPGRESMGPRQAIDLDEPGAKTDPQAPLVALDRRSRVGLLWAAGVLLLGFFFLPMQLMWPEPWWGVRVRCALPAYLVLIALVRPRRRGLPQLVVLPAAAAALAFFVYMTVDFSTHWRRRLDGFDAALAALPMGASVMGLNALPEKHYALNHPYLVQHAVARKGGRAVPHLKGHPGSYWITMKPPPPSPDWGHPALFDWKAHGAGYDYFLVEKPVDGPWPDLPARAPEGAVAPVVQGAGWRLYQNLERAAPPGSPPEPEAPGAR